MSLITRQRSRVAQWPYPVISILAALAAFGAYTSMYAFRKAFSAATFEGSQYLNVDYKAWLVIAQVAGYALSKFYGIRFIAELNPRKRAYFILLFIGISWLALLAFAFIPAPYNIICLFINGFPLGMIWGMIFSYLEGRKSTEFMAGVLSISLIFASGFVKTVARSLMSSFHINEYFMPFLTGAVFVLPLLLFVYFLELIPPPTAEDVQLRHKRGPMSSQERKQFLIRFLPGILLTVFTYLLLTIIRDVRDNFEVEIWSSLGVKDNTIFTKIDSIISIIVLVIISLLILVKDNFKAFSLIHWMIITGCLAAGTGALLFSYSLISPAVWMTLAGLGLYMGYVPYNAIFFERMIASFNYGSNVGFIMYVADFTGYLGSVSVLLVKELGKPDISWNSFFHEAVLLVAVAGGISTVLSLIYFTQTANRKNQKKQLKVFPA